MSADGDSRGTSSDRRRLRHRGPRRATGGTTVSQGEPEHFADRTVLPAGRSRANAEPGGTEGTDGGTASGATTEDARGRWLREQRPPHWG